MGKSAEREDGWPRRAVTTMIGGGLAVYGLWVLLRIPAALRSGWLVSPPRIIGPRAWTWTAGLAGSPWLGWTVTGTDWIVSAVLVIGGIEVIFRHTRGIRAAVVALAIKLLLRVLGIPFMFALALGWVVFDSSDPRFKQLAQVPLVVQRYIWWWSMVPALVWTLVLAGAILWLRRELATTAGSDGIRATGDTPDC